VKLLFDENLSESLVRRLVDVFPGSGHLRDLGLTGADDRTVWAFAATHGFAIVTKDDDFRELSIVHGAPPKLVMVSMGNCPTREIETILRRNREAMERFNDDRVTSLMELG